MSDSIASAHKASAVTPDDSATLPLGLCRAFYVGATGHVVARVGGVEVTFLNVQAGTVMPIKTDLIKATGTTATGIVALY